ncbi:MAG: hypothetical protein JHC95_04945 [Solirubrobacteraceae bacterium]|nr:hypothetical protein [Solirubrobacteraceae bacterium]
MRRRLLPLLLLAPLAAAQPAAAADPWERQNESFACADDTGSKPFYNGDSASKVYDSAFALGHDIPQAMLDGYVPQGLGTWDGLLLQTAYNDDTHRAVVVGMVPGGGSTQMPVLVRPGNKGFVDAHVGGVAVVGAWMFVAGPTVDGLPTILRFPLDRVRKRLADGQPLKAGAELKVNVGTAGFAASFLAAEGSTIWAGTFDDDSRNRMYQLQVGPKGGLARVGGPGNWRQIPKKTQGLAVTPGHFLFSTSYGSKNRSNVYVVRRGKKFLDNAYPQDLTCFAAPSMSEGITVLGDQAFLTFESGSFRYRADPCDKPVFEGDCTRNVITHLHRAPVGSLVGMT